MLEGLDNRMKRQVALAMLITLVDSNDGTVYINSDTVKRVFNDENEIIKIEYANGVIALAADADFDTMNEAILKWKGDNPQKFDSIMEDVSRKASRMGI